MRYCFTFLIVVVLFVSCKKSSNSAPGSLPDGYSNQGLGKSANDVLSGSKYTAINIQVQYMPGYALDNTVLTNVRDYLNALCNKPGGVTVGQSEIAGNGDTLNETTVSLIEAANRTAYTSGNTIALYILVTDGYDTAANALGFAYRNTSIALFGKEIFTHSGGLGEVSRANLETAVLEHELGHIMGLVNLGSAMVHPHQDVLHGNHCTNTNCLMYYEMESNIGLGMMLSGGGVPALDSNCRADLRSNGGK